MVGNKQVKVKARWDDRVIDFISYGVITLVAIAMLYPIMNVLAVSMSSYVAYATNPWMFIPYDFDFAAFEAVFGSNLIMIGYRNTIFITIAGTLFTLIITILTAYPLSRGGFRGKGFFMTVIIFTMLFNGGLVPNFLLIRDLGLYNNIFAQILPGILSAFNVILMLNFFKELPQELLEAARVDGASEPRVLFQIVVPLSKAVIATIALFAAVGYWNSYFSAILYARDQELWPVQLVLREIIMQANTAMLNAEGNMAEVDMGALPLDSLKYASTVVVMVPIMAVYPFIQKHFTKGVMIGAVKG